jgi:glycosyltransferase involved in cell wall biosynthesis
MAEPTLSVVLPCYNEAPGLAQILRRFAEVGQDVAYELILVDNGSTDNTAEVLGQLLPSYPFARCVTVTANRGYGDGIFTGLKAARGKTLAWSHADLQTDPQDVFRAFSAYRLATAPEKLVVKGRRHGRRLADCLISRGMEIVALLLLRTWLTEINAQPKVFDARLLEYLTAPPVDFNFDVYVLYQARRHGWRIATIDVDFPPRRHGQSNWAATWRSKRRTILRSMRYMFQLGYGRAS